MGIDKMFLQIVYKLCLLLPVQVLDVVEKHGKIPNPKVIHGREFFKHKLFVRRALCAVIVQIKPRRHGKNKSYLVLPGAFYQVGKFGFFVLGVRLAPFCPVPWVVLGGVDVGVKVITAAKIHHHNPFFVRPWRAVKTFHNAAHGYRRRRGEIGRRQGKSSQHSR